MYVIKGSTGTQPLLDLDINIKATWAIATSFSAEAELHREVYTTMTAMLNEHIPYMQKWNQYK